MNRRMKDIRELLRDCLKKTFLKKHYLTETGKVRMSRLQKIWKKNIPRRGTHKYIRPEYRKGLTVFEGQNGCKGGWSIVCEEGRMV